MPDRRPILVGIDCACQPGNIGLARAEWLRDGSVQLTDVVRGDEVPSVAGLMAKWVADSKRCLLALDAPLGWPEALGRTLNAHSAGTVIKEHPDRLFRRETDRDIHRRFRKMPLEVGADRIARTARAALFLLNEVRSRTGLDIPLLWDPADGIRAAAIEVYPAGTLLAHGLPATGYKKTEQRAVRATILDRLGELLQLPADPERLLSDANRLDAVVCILAAVDFMQGRALPPANPASAKKEGWIWVAERQSG